ncbi:IclR family transcriptional regulator [Pseudorhizobium flavum]|uniref:IclR family transcriptional regulator n=1 Tax=Pseudorhizobium flavum TaxID=1335061 RepID=UPI00377008A9
MSQHRVPAVDTAIQMLKVLAKTPDISIKEIISDVNVTRSTAYRILNSLEDGGLIKGSDRNTFQLGLGLKRLAQAVRLELDLGSIAQPEMDKAAQELGYSVKLSVIDGLEALIIAVAASNNPYAIHTEPGRRFPLHAGAASKVLLAFAAQPLRDKVLNGDLAALTDQTNTDPLNLQGELRKVRQQGWAIDHGEHARSVHAVAVPVFGPEGECLAALSIPYLQNDEEQALPILLPRLQECGLRLSEFLATHT